MTGSTLETTRLLLRPMQLSDADALLHVFADPQVMAAFSEPPFDRTRMLSWVNRNLEHQAEHGYGLFAVVLKSTATVIGDCGLEVMTVEGERVAELGYDFRSDHWNQGFATEAARAVRDFAFQTLRLPGLISLIRVGNHASRRVAEKIGMHCQAEFDRGDHRYWRYTLEAPE
jgi:RimJ/RimL family protein N-acetyltransferase